MLDSQCCHEVKVSCYQMEGTQRALGNVIIIAVKAHLVSLLTLVGHLRLFKNTCRARCWALWLHVVLIAHSLLCLSKKCLIH